MKKLLSLIFFIVICFSVNIVVAAPTEKEWATAAAYLLETTSKASLLGSYYYGNSDLRKQASDNWKSAKWIFEKSQPPTADTQRLKYKLINLCDEISSAFERGAGSYEWQVISPKVQEVLDELISIISGQKEEQKIQEQKEKEEHERERRERAAEREKERQRQIEMSKQRKESYTEGVNLFNKKQYEKAVEKLQSAKSHSEELSQGYKKEITDEQIEKMLNQSRIKLRDVFIEDGIKMFKNGENENSTKKLNSALEINDNISSADKIPQEKRVKIYVYLADANFKLKEYSSVVKNCETGLKYDSHNKELLKFLDIIKSKKKKAVIKSTINSSLRSVILPGWGQYYCDYDKWYYHSLAYITFLGGTFYYYNQGNEYYKKYEKATNSSDAEDYWNKAIQYDKTTVVLGIATIGVWTYSVVDAYFKGKEYGHISWDYVSNIKIEKDSIKLVYAKKF